MTIQREDDSGRDTAPLDGAEAPCVGVRPDAGRLLDGKYLVEREVGRGGMGIVYAAKNVRLGERVAIKVLRPDAVGRGEAVERLEREARAVARIKSEHVARVLDAGTLDTGEPFLVLEYLDGQNLASALRERARLPVAEAVELVLQACEAMAAAHALGIVHRDLKPSNLLVVRVADGRSVLKVVDFGIAKAMDDHPSLVDGEVNTLTATTTVLGSPAYMAPEQVRSARDVDARADVWALGVILFELLAGSLPFSGESSSGLLAAVAADRPASLRARRGDVPSGLEAAIHRCLDKDRERRTPDVAAFAAQIARFAGSGGALSAARTARILGASVRPRLWRKAAAAGGGAAVLAVLGSVAIASRPPRVAPPPVEAPPHVAAPTAAAIARPPPAVRAMPPAAPASAAPAPALSPKARRPVLKRAAPPRPAATPETDLETATAERK